MTVGDKFFISGLICVLRSYIKRCHKWQLSRNEKNPVRPSQHYRWLSRLIVDLKGMPKPYQGHKFVLCVTDWVTNYLITVPIHKARSEEKSDILIDNVI